MNNDSTAFSRPLLEDIPEAVAWLSRVVTRTGEMQTHSVLRSREGTPKATYFVRPAVKKALGSKSSDKTVDNKGLLINLGAN
jgi:hypothetical protein